MINIQNIEADAAAVFSKLPAISSDLSDLAFVLALIPATAPAALIIKEGLAALSAVQVVTGDLPAFLAAGIKIETDFKNALSSAQGVTTAPTIPSAISAASLLNVASAVAPVKDVAALSAVEQAVQAVKTI